MGSEATEGIRLAAGRTRQRRIHVSCECGEAYATRVYAGINATDDPEAADRFAQGTLNQATCPSCGVTTALHLPVVYHDPSLPLLTVVLPETMRHAELQARIDLLQKLADEPDDLPAYARQADVVFGVAGLLRKRSAGDAPATGSDEINLRLALTEQRETALDQREEELLAREEDLASKQEDLLTRQSELEHAREELTDARAELEREREALRALSLDLAGQRRLLATERRQRPVRLPSPTSARRAEAVAEPATPETTPPPAPALETEADRPREEIDRWRAGEAPTASFLHEGQVYLCARPGTSLEPYREQPPALRLQLHQQAEAQVAVIVALPADRPGQPAEHALRWLLDPSDDRHRALLRQLGEAFAIHLDLYDDESRPVASWEIEAPLAENARALVAVTEDSDTTRSATDALLARLAELPAEELLGRKQHNFSEDSFVELPSPSAARLALGIVGYWSEPDNEQYLLLTKSFPLPHWREIRQRVVQRALEFGLHLGPQLNEFALELELASSPPELLRRAVASFAEVSLGLTTNDLDPIQEWGNWKALLADCVQLGVQVEQQIETLAAGAARRAHEWGAAMVDESEPGGDLSTLNEKRLLHLLTDHGQRRDAALELCERGSAEAAKAVFAAVRNMTRAEVVRVIPAMVQLGESALPLFIQGLHHHKSFIRQGCALGLGTLKGRAGGEPLIEMLLSEPTRIWMEAARALGDIGASMLEVISTALGKADGEGRERLAWAMAHVALGEDGRHEVERLSEAETSPPSKAARRALQLLIQVSRIDAEVRGGGPVREQTIVRAFSRRFYESMSGDVNELSEEDIVEQEEVLGDADILEALEVEGAKALT